MSTEIREKLQELGEKILNPGADTDIESLIAEYLLKKGQLNQTNFTTDHDFALFCADVEHVIAQRQREFVEANGSKHIVGATRVEQPYIQTTEWHKSQSFLMERYPH